MLHGKKIILGISGGIAAYKSPLLIRLFIKAGAEVKVAITKNALQFVTLPVLETLSGNRVYSGVFDPANDYSTEHVSLTDWGDIFVVAPATANIIGKYASGIADDALSTSLLAFDRQVFIAPAMNSKMIGHFTLKKNSDYLKSNGVTFIDAPVGMLACGYEGQGRMEEPENIFNEIVHFFTRSAALKGKKVLITAGPTFEAIDPVRFIGNHSSGMMGFALAHEAADRGAEVTLVAGPSKLTVENNSINRIDVVSAEQMYNQCKLLFPSSDITIMSAAVADYKPLSPENSKIKKTAKLLHLTLMQTIDILSEMGKIKRKNQILIGFALESDNEMENAKLKLSNKNLDYIVLNSLRDSGAGFNSDTNKVKIMDKSMNIYEYQLKQKAGVAKDILDLIQKDINK